MRARRLRPSCRNSAGRTRPGSRRAGERSENLRYSVRTDGRDRAPPEAPTRHPAAQHARNRTGGRDQIVEGCARHLEVLAQALVGRVHQIAEQETSAKKTMPILELVDSPPLRLDGSDTALLGELRQVDAYAVLIPRFADPKTTDENVRSALVMADIELMTRAIEKLKKRVKRPTGNQEDEKAELEILTSLVEETADGKIRDLTPQEEKKLVDPRYRSELLDAVTRAIERFYAVTVNGIEIADR